MNKKYADDSLSQRKKGRFFVNIGIWVLVFVIIIVVLSPARDAILNHFFHQTSATTPTVTPGDNLFFIQAIPSGSVYLDGHLLIQPPTPGGKPLSLSYGRHQILWKAAPFNPLSCIVSVPSSLTAGQCNYESPVPYAGANARLITFDPTLTDLSAAQRTVLIQHIQVVLTSLQSTAIVQPGEQYASTSPAGLLSTLTANQPLKATLSFHLDTNPASTKPCLNGSGDDCALEGQSCLQFCNAPMLNQGAASTTGVDLDMLALFYPTWTYTTASGQIVAQHQPDTTATNVGTDHSILLHITWDHSGWHISRITAENAFFETPGNADPACASINNSIHITPAYQYTAAIGNVSWQLFAGTNRAAGCLGIVTPDNSQQPPAYCLYRFGILLAANAAAHRYFPMLPVADASEQAIAQQIANEAGI